MKKLVILIVVTALYLIAFGFVAHAIVLEDMYLDMQAMMRTEPEAMGLMAWIYLAYLLQAWVLATFYVKLGAGGGVGGGFRFGAMAGILVGSVMLVLHAIYPFTLSHSLTLFATDVIHFTGAGIVLALVAPRLK
jgi:hypothetical protein